MTIATANVNRWHSHHDLRNSGDTIRGHCRRCVVLIRAMNPKPTATLIAAVLHHDDIEAVLGDMPFPAKYRFPALAAAYAEAERELIEAHNIPQPANEIEREWLKLVDRYDAYLWAEAFGPDDMTDQPEWRECMEDIVIRATALGAHRSLLDGWAAWLCEVGC